MPSTKRKDYVAPVFNEYGMEELHRKTGYLYATLEVYATGARPITKQFKRRVSTILERPESELFGEPDAPEAQ